MPYKVNPTTGQLDYYEEAGSGGGGGGGSYNGPGGPGGKGGDGLIIIVTI